MNFTLKNIIFYHSHMQSKTVHVARTFRYKSVKTSQTDYVKVDFSTYRGGDKENIVFKDRYGIKLKLIDDNTLAFTASNKPDTNYIYAYDKDGVRIGKLFVYTYNQKIHNVFLVPVKSNGTQNVNLPNVEEVSRAVKKTFNQSVTSFKFQIVDPVIIPDLTTFTHGGSKWTSVFNDDQKKVLEAYDDKMNDNDFYLFFVDNVLDKFDSFGTSVAGYMPRGYNCRFIYDGGSPHTIAHELGHGVGNLEHAFEKSNTSGKTKNLMDYSDGEELYHFQWNEIQDPSRVWLKWSKDESEGENQIGDDYVCTMKFINEFCYAYLNKTSLNYEADGLLGHSCNISFLSLYNNYNINIKILKTFDNYYPNSNNLSEYTEYLKTNFNQEIFEEIINDYQRRERQYLKDIKDDNLSVKKLLETLAILPTEAYLKIDIDTRKKLVKKLSEENLHSAYISCVDDEKIVLTLIANTSNNEWRNLLDYVFSNNSEIFNKLCYHIDGANYKTLIAVLSNMFITAYAEECARGFVENYENLPFKPQKITYTYRKETSNVTYKDGVYTFNSISLSPNSIINVRGIDIPDYLDLDNWFKNNPQTFIPIPAFLLAHIIEEPNDKNVLKFLSVVLPIEDVYIIFTGEDFDGNEASRLMAGCFVVLDIVQIGKVVKVLKFTKTGIANAKKSTKITQKTIIKTQTKKFTEQMVYDISLQFLVQLFNQFYDNDDWSENLIIKALLKVNVDRAIYSSSFNFTNNKIPPQVLSCALQFLNELRSGIDVQNILNGSANCLIELACYYIKIVLIANKKSTLKQLNLTEAKLLNLVDSYTQKINLNGNFKGNVILQNFVKTLLKTSFKRFGNELFEDKVIVNS